MGVEGLDPDAECQLCFTRRRLHGEKHHDFVEEGQDPGAAVKPPNKKKPPEQAKTTLIVSPAPDIVLRQLLLEKGLIRPEELEAKERELTLGTVGIRSADNSRGFFAEPPANG
jgi:hypothetical protein